MNDKECIGELRKIDPKKIIKLGDNNKVDNFFLILGLVFNDLKSLIFYSELVKDEFKDIDKNSVTCENGEYGGINSHLSRLVSSTIFEFFKTLQNQTKVISSSSFQIIFNKLNKKEKMLWQEMLDLANKKNISQKGVEFIDILENIRNNGSFHYYNSGEQLRKGFIDHFYTRHDQHKSNELAYFFKGNNILKNRYFYCDAAIQGFNYVRIKDKMSYEDYLKQIIEIGVRINIIIAALIKVYLASKK